MTRRIPDRRNRTALYFTTCRSGLSAFHSSSQGFEDLFPHSFPRRQSSQAIIVRASLSSGYRLPSGIGAITRVVPLFSAVVANDIWTSDGIVDVVQVAVIKITLPAVWMSLFSLTRGDLADRVRGRNWFFGRCLSGRRIRGIFAGTYLDKRRMDMRSFVRRNCRAGQADTSKMHLSRPLDRDARRCVPPMMRRFPCLGKELQRDGSGSRVSVTL
jgi:hypothetical protein